MSEKIKALVEKAKAYGEVIKSWMEALEGKKDIKSKVAVLAAPDHKESMSVLTSPQARFVSISNFMADVEEWGGMFKGLKKYAQDVMDVSPSVGGLGREQVIRFAGALTESKLAEKLGLSVKEGSEEEKQKD